MEASTQDDGTKVSIIGVSMADVIAKREELLSGSSVSLSLLGLAGTVDRIEEVAAMPELARVTSLTLAGSSPSWRNLAPPSEALAALAASPHLRDVRRLVLEKNVLDDPGAHALAAAPWLASVEELLIVDNPKVFGTGLRAFGRQFTVLKRLYGARSAFGAEGVLAFTSGTSPVLADVDLDECAVGEAGSRALFNSPAMTTITRLRISHDTVRDGLVAFARRPASALESLELPRCSINGRNATELAAGVAHRGLTFLDLQNNLLDDQAAIALASSRAFPALEKLDLRDNGIGPAGATALGAADSTLPVTELGLTANDLKTGASHVHSWEGGMWEAGSVVVEEKLTADRIQSMFVKRPSLRVF